MLTSDEVRDARRLFHEADADGNGVLDLNEFKALLRSVSSSHSDDDLVSLFRRADADGSGTIEFDEFLQMQLKRRSMIGAAAFARVAMWAAAEVTPRSPEARRSQLTPRGARRMAKITRNNHATAASAIVGTGAAAHGPLLPAARMERR